MKRPSVKFFNPPLRLSKNRILLAFTALALLMPELLWHKFSLILHILYETASFLMEEVLMHGLGLTKHSAQVAVFYALFCLAILGLGYLWRHLPRLMQAAKARMLLAMLRLKYHLLETWLALNLRQKIQWLSLQLLGISVGFMLLLA